jgi:hypothetical protein
MGVEYEHWLLPRNRDYRPASGGVARLVDALRRERWVVAPGEPHFAEMRGGFGTPRGISTEADTGGYASVFGKNPNFPDDPNAFVVDPNKIRRGLPLHQPIPVPLTSDWIDARIDPHHANPLAREMGLFFPVQLPDDVFSDWQEAGIKYPFTFGEDDLSNYHQVMLYLADDFVTHDWTNTFGDALDDKCSCGEKLGYNPDGKYVQYVVALSIDGRISRKCPACGTVFNPSLHSTLVSDGWDEGATCHLRGGVTFRFAVRIDCHKGWPREHGRIFLKPEFRQLIEASLGEAFEDIGGLY